MSRERGNVTGRSVGDLLFLDLGIVVKVHHLTTIVSDAGAEQKQPRVAYTAMHRHRSCKTGHQRNPSIHSPIRGDVAMPCGSARQVLNYDDNITTSTSGAKPSNSSCRGAYEVDHRRSITTRRPYQRYTPVRAGREEARACCMIFIQPAKGRHGPCLFKMDELGDLWDCPIAMHPFWRDFPPLNCSIRGRSVASKSNVRSSDTARKFLEVYI